MRQIKGRGKTQGNSRKNFTNAKEGKGRIREQESAGQLNNKAKTQNNISLSKNRIKTEKRHNQRMAKQIQKRTVEASKLLKDENKTMEMDQNEYNDLLTKKENAEKEMKSQKEIFEKAQAKAKDLEAKIGKCNLAWRTLFTNKTWDDIQLRAKQTKGRFTRRKDEEIIEEPIEIEDKEIKEEIGKNVRKIQEEQKEKKNLPAKVTTWTKIKNFFKSIPAKIKEKFGKEEVEEKSTNSKSTKQQKDEFLDALRQNVDVDYREAVRKATTKPKRTRLPHQSVFYHSRKTPPIKLKLLTLQPFNQFFNTPISFLDRNNNHESIRIPLFHNLSTQI